MGGCVCAPRSLGAAPLKWQDGFQQMQAETQAVGGAAALGGSSLSERMATHIAAEQAIVTTNAFQVDLAQTPIPVLALPESGTLILLGIGLAGLASLIRRKKD